MIPVDNNGFNKKKMIFEDLNYNKSSLQTST